MTRRTLWAVRLLMLAVVAAVVLVVRTSLMVRKPTPPSTPTPMAVVETPPPAGKDMWLSGFNYQRFDADGRATVIKAASYLGQDQDEIRLRQVEVDFVYMAKGKPGKTHIVADEAVMTPKINKGDFRGHVVLTTEEPIPTKSGETTKGFELRTEQLIYRGDKGIARTEAPVTFKRKDVSGSSRGLVYNAEAGLVTFPAEAYVRIDDENVGPTQIRSSRASLDREKGVMKFEDGVRMNHGAETLVSKTLIVGYAEEGLSINRFQAIDDVVLNVSGSTVLPGTKTALMGKGSRTIRAKRLFALFRPDRTLEEVTAVDDAELVLTPPPGDPADPSTLKGGALGFVFDGQGQLTELQATKGASFVTRPKTGTGLRIDSQRLLVNVDPPSGSMKSMQFDRDVNLVRGTQKATSARARFDLVNNALDLLDGPRMTDSSDGSDLVANSISLETKTQNLKARNNVRQTVKPGKAADGPFGSASAPTVITGATLEYDGAQHRASYRGGVLLRSGTDEIRSKELALQNAGPGQRVLKANGQVSATMGTKDAGAEAKDDKPTAVQSRSETLEYDEARRTLRYSGDVTLLLGVLRTRSPRAEVLLAEGGQAVQELRAGEPVDAYQEKRQAKGEKLVYVPAEKSVSLTGKLVSFKDLEREMQGKSLTFFLGDDRIIVDGRERGRTETLIRPKESPKP
jgi:LPS export ABC transporter protein LptC/lipopolysaccharide transport protein LptA